MSTFNRRRAAPVLVSFVAGMVTQMFLNSYEVSMFEGWPAITPYTCPVRFRVMGNCSCVDLQSQLSKCHQTKFVTQFKTCHVPIQKTKTGVKSPKKIFLDCGANVASSVQLFRETYPGGHDYVIHSFELDERLRPYFAPYSNHELHCPTAVSDTDGEMTAFSESAWSPDKGKNNGVDMQWGGGSLFVSEDEKQDTDTGGLRKLSYRRAVPTVDLSRWIQANFAVEDDIMFKLDVEGAEYAILKKMLKDGTFRWIDKPPPTLRKSRRCLTVLPTDASSGIVTFSSTNPPSRPAWTDGIRLTSRKTEQNFTHTIFSSRTLLRKVLFHNILQVTWLYLDAMMYTR